MKQEATQKEEEAEKTNSISSRVVDCLLYNKDFFQTADLIRTSIEKKEFDEFKESELEWLSFRIELISNILESENACAVFYWLLKGQEINRHFSVYSIAKKLGVYQRTVQHWMSVFRRNALLIEAKRRMNGARIFKDYYFNPKLMNIVNLIYEVIQREMGNKLIKIANKNHNIQWTAIKKWRQKNPEKTRKYMHNKLKKY